MKEVEGILEGNISASGAEAIVAIMGLAAGGGGHIIGCHGEVTPSWFGRLGVNMMIAFDCSLLKYVSQRRLFCSSYDIITSMIVFEKERIDEKIN